MKFFSPDSVHLNRRNFTSLHEFIIDGKHEYVQHDRLNHLIGRYGDYKDLPVEFVDDVELYSQFDVEMLVSTEICGINLLETCWLEILSFISADPQFSELGVVPTRNQVVLFLSEKYRYVLVCNVAVAAFWIKYWKAYLETSPTFDGVFIFSGALTYCRTLIELLKKTPIRVFLFESFFTGNDYYCEERFSPIPNASFLGSSNFYESIETNQAAFDNDRVKAINKVILASNLNVKQPPPLIGRGVESDGFLLLLGQVVNDFSVLGFGEAGISTLALYSELIKRLLEGTREIIVFKAHPWENAKANVRRSLTKDFLSEKFEPYINNRLFIVEDYNINSLFQRARCVVLINSQSGIESAWNGIKPITLGSPFYGNKGFTIDFEANDIEGVVEYVSSHDAADFTLTLDEYDFFECFLVKSLIYSLVSKHKSGVSLLKASFASIQPIKLARASKVTNSPTGYPKNEHRDSSLVVDKEDSSLVVDKEKTNLTPFRRKLRKLKRNPRLFFLDSKNPILHHLGIMLSR